MNRKVKTSLIAIGIVILAIVVFQVFSEMKEAPEPPRVYRSIKYATTDIIKYRSHVPNIVAYGRLKSNNKIEVYSEVSGIVLENDKKFKVGNSFSKNDVMVKVDDEEQRLNLYSQKSDFLNLLTKMMPDIKADFPESFSIWNKYLDDFQIEGAIKKLPEPSSAKEKYFLAGRNIYKLYYSIQNSEVRLSKYNIRAPFNGVVTQRLIETGTSIRTGQKLGEFAGTIVFELELAVDMSEVEYISIGSPVKVTSEKNDHKWNGKVVRISDNIDPSTQTISVFVHISGNGLYDGLYLKGMIKGKLIKDSYKLPRKALVNNQFVHIIKDSTLGLKKVDIIMLSEKYAFIHGIDSLTEVITEPLVNTPVGTKVVPIKN